VRFLVSKEIVRLELEILSEIDRRVSKTEGIGRQHPIAFWVCLWTLILSYKDHRIWLGLVFSDGNSYLFNGTVDFLLTSLKETNHFMSSRITYITR
jgi:hypothetical protein